MSGQACSFSRLPRWISKSRGAFSRNQHDLVPARQDDHASLTGAGRSASRPGANHREGSVTDAEVCVVVLSIHLTIKGEGGRAVDTAEAELRHMLLVIQPAAYQPSGHHCRHDADLAKRTPGLQNSHIDQPVVDPI